VTDAEYRECCRCWRVYLDHIDRRGSAAFTHMVRRELTWVDRLLVWPLVWPSALEMFRAPGRTDDDARREFVRIVNLASEHGLRPGALAP
jgi:hypothetical protein